VFVEKGAEVYAKAQFHADDRPSERRENDDRVKLRHAAYLERRAWRLSFD
jgi:hypothetical protein